MASTLNPSKLSGFRDLFAGEVLVPGDAGYDEARVVWNGLADRRPAVIARCAGIEDVISAVRLGREQDLVVAVRGGGHSVAGFSTCDGGIVIDLSRMRGVSVDPERKHARTEGGAHLSQLDQAAQAHGLVCPVGVVGHTGVAGLTLGGGMGRLQRNFGLTIDNLVGVDVVLASGQQVHASEDENADLFWAIRGAGANFGVVTSFEFRLHPMQGTIFQGMVVHPIERSHEVGGLLREFVATHDDVFASLAFGLAYPGPPFPPEIAGRPVIMLGATHLGSREDAERDLAPLRNLDPVVDTFGPKPYLAVQAMADDAMAWGKRFYMKSGYVGAITDGLIDACVSQVERIPSGGECSYTLWAMGGAIGRVANDAMAFTGRDALFWAGAEVLWEGPDGDESHIAWGRAAMAALKPFMTVGAYVNDVVESDLDTVHGVYGRAKYDRLVGLKRTYDPDNVFRLNQNIRP